MLKKLFIFKVKKKQYFKDKTTNLQKLLIITISLVLESTYTKKLGKVTLTILIYYKHTFSMILFLSWFGLGRTLVSVTIASVKSISVYFIIYYWIDLVLI